MDIYYLNDQATVSGECGEEFVTRYNYNYHSGFYFLEPIPVLKSGFQMWTDKPLAVADVKGSAIIGSLPADQLSRIFGNRFPQLMSASQHFFGSLFKFLLTALPYRGVGLSLPQVISTTENFMNSIGTTQKTKYRLQ